MKITNNDIVLYMNHSDDDNYIFLFRLYDEYKNNFIEDDTMFSKISILDLKTAYTSIVRKASNISEAQEKYFSSDYILNMIKDELLILTRYISHFNELKQDVLEETINSITRLEVILKLPISFPFYLERCLEKELDIRKGIVNQKSEE